MNIQEEKLKLSVCVITYNHEKYIRQCLQSIVDQKLDFNFEIIVGEDCSVDGTRLIVQEFEKKYPEIIKPIYHQKNIDGGSYNYLTVHAAACGEYIAHIDGDDYCLPGKLKAQVELLDSDPSCNIVFHRMKGLKPSGEIIKDNFLDTINIGDYKFGRAEILRFMAIGMHSSKMYRRKNRDFEAPVFPVMDYFLNVEHIKDGHARFVGNEYLGVYRIGGGLATTGVKSRMVLAQSFIYFNKKYPQFRPEINTASLTYFLADLKNKRKTWIMFLKVWLRTFSWKSIPMLLINLKFIRQLRIG
jgi:glycosyltransferase involved in cell wall biosynthesis